MIITTQEQAAELARPYMHHSTVAVDSNGNIFCNGDHEALVREGRVLFVLKGETPTKQKKRNDPK